ncbi:MAG: hypothetical protein QXM31_00725 [Candidatus Woesearchaeota archaeon]
MKKIILFFLLALLLAACRAREQTPFVAGTPVEIVQKYYAAWGAKDYKTMYTLVSDGWKALEPTAHTELRFANHLGGFYKSAKAIRLVFASEQSNTGSQSVVSAALEVETMDGRFVLANQTVVLRLKDNGWKLIHPYGEFTDLS